MRRIDQINEGWEFHLGDIENGSEYDPDSGGWEPVTVPHDWSIAGLFDKKWASATGYLPAGIGWYRKNIMLPEDWNYSRTYLHFDGVYNNSSVWINGVHVGDRPNGFIPFRYDITSLLNSDALNNILVRCDHSQYADSRWYTGSGINRNVYLIGTGAVHIKQWGLFASTSSVTDNCANLSVQSTIQNHMDALSICKVEHTLQDTRGTIVAEACAAVEIAPGGEATLPTQLFVDDPALWSIDRPELYTLRTVVHSNGQVSDTEETQVGIRTFLFDANSGFTLNGTNLKLKGVCLHDDAGALGTAVPAGVWARRLRTLKEGGVNAIRMSHNPHMPELYDLCDKMGFVVQDEAFDEWEHGKNKWIEGWNAGKPGKDGYSAHFERWAEADLRDMILSHRNHPSIIMWSIGNEIDYPNDPYTHEVLDHGFSPQIFGDGYRSQAHAPAPHAEGLGRIASRLVAVAKQYDPTRPITAGLASALMSNEVGYADVLDIVGYNYQESRYAEDHAKFPDRVIYGSENGMLGSFWNAVTSNPYICGQFLWTGIDYLGEAHGWPERGSRAGILDLAGNPKAEYYFRKSLWTDEPMAHLGTSCVSTAGRKQGLWDQHKARPVWAGETGEPVRVRCFTNCTVAELFVNGSSRGLKERWCAPEGVITWDVAYEPGELLLNAYHEDTVVSASLKTAGEPARLIAKCDTTRLLVGSEDVAHIDVIVVDNAGTIIDSSEFAVTWSIEGPGRLLGVENGNQASHQNYKSNIQETFEGRLLGYIKAASPESIITVTLTSPGLEEAIVTIPTT